MNLEEMKVLRALEMGLEYAEMVLEQADDENAPDSVLEGMQQHIARIKVAIDIVESWDTKE